MEEKKLICIGCPLGCELCAVLERGEVISVTGNTCKRGDAYARKELVSPERTVTSTVKMSDGRMEIYFHQKLFPVLEKLEI